MLQNNGVSLPLEGQSATTPDTRLVKGIALQKAIFGEAIAFTGLILSSEMAAATASAMQKHVFSTNRAWGKHPIARVPFLR